MRMQMGMAMRIEIALTGIGERNDGVIEAGKSTVAFRFLSRARDAPRSRLRHVLRRSLRMFSLSAS